MTWSCVCMWQELEQLSTQDIVIFFLGVCILIFAVTLTNISGARKQRALDERMSLQVVFFCAL